MIVTLDTNILYQALRSERGSSFRILQLVQSEKIQMAISIPVYQEYQDVLLRPSSINSFNYNENQVKTILKVIAKVGKQQNIFFKWRPNLRDEDDNMFVELAIASQSEWLVTNNIRDFTIDNELLPLGFVVGKPNEFLDYLEKYHG